MSLENSFISEENCVSFKDFLFSTSPMVFMDIENFIETPERDEILHLKYQIVMKDVIIYGLKKQVEKMQFPYTCWISLTDVFLK